MEWKDIGSFYKGVVMATVYMGLTFIPFWLLGYQWSDEVDMNFVMLAAGWVVLTLPVYIVLCTKIERIFQ